MLKLSCIWISKYAVVEQRSDNEEQPNPHEGEEEITQQVCDILLIVAAQSNVVIESWERCDENNHDLEDKVESE